MNLNFAVCKSWGIDRAIAAYEAGDGAAFVCAVPSNATLCFVFDNFLQLKERGMYESALHERGVRWQPFKRRL